MSPNTRPFRLVSIGLAAIATMLGACSSSSPEAGSDAGFATEVSCEPMDAQGEGLCDGHFGVAWNGSQCVSINGCSCVGSDCSSIYAEPAACEADHAGCAGSASCEPMDAQGEGLCDGHFGVAWNGSQCVSINGCSCVGSDCSNSYPDQAACEADHAGC